MTGTGLLTLRCDPYGAESRIQLLGGLYPEQMNGRHHWYCDNRADARYRMVCTGGTYGLSTCPGGHKGQVMPLCAAHRSEIGRRQSGLCPRCCWPPQALGWHEAGQAAERELRLALQAGSPQQVAAAQRKMERAGARLQELWVAGIVHKCPLRLEEVS